NAIGLAVTGPAGATVISYTVDIPVAVDGTGALYSGWGTAWDDFVMGTAAPGAATTYLAHIHGVTRTAGTAGNLTPRFRSEVAGTQVTIKAQSWGALYTP